MTVQFVPEIEQRLREKAERENRSINEVAEALITAALEAEAQDDAECDEALERGLQAEREGRFTPLAEWDRKFRVRHGITMPDAGDPSAPIDEKIAA